MAIFLVVFRFGKNSGEQPLGDEWRFLETVIRWPKPIHEWKRLDKLISQAKIPPISGKSHCSLARPTVIARVYDFNPAVATPGQEQHHE
jgi:hypothetical protein